MSNRRAIDPPTRTATKSIMASGTFLVIFPAFAGLFFAFWLFTRKLSKISLHGGRHVPRVSSASSMTARTTDDESSDEALMRHMETGDASSTIDAYARVRVIYRDIQEGAKAFLAAEYRMCIVFCLSFAVFIAVLVSYSSHGFEPWVGFMTAFAFVSGGATSMVSGYIGMMIAVYTNARCAVSAAITPDAVARKESFNAAFRGGSVMGFALSGLGLIVLYFLLIVYSWV